ncbi:hypothetical protein CAEBREN_24184 [Caenorhabditis brenneri]|uniref:p-granule-associated protein DEPS-1 second OB-fold domain-containing protein n=1 Tax=Caenorhabditis brenneri TaxID=135651 RepID=G0NBP9_CAEBE|nr:hypothetical protein CAEBREN_24184 [Caenorhabditis brenneri]
MTRGIVITNGNAANTKVLVFETGYQSIRDFQVLPVQQKPKDALNYGDSLEFSIPRGGQVVREYRKVRKVYETCLFDGEPQILLQGIMSPDRKVLWMCNIWPDLEIPFRLHQMAHPNVTVNAWVILKIRENQTLKYELHSFKETADSFQSLARKAKWNEGQLGNLSVLYDPVEEKSQNKEYQSTLADTLTGMHGIVISKKIALVTSHPGYCFHRVVIRDGDNYPENGTTIRFNAEKLEFLNIYALKNFSVVSTQKQMPLSPNGRVKVTINYQEGLHGFYYCKTLNCFVDDPDNLLEAWLLSEYRKSALQIGITATEPSTRGTPRFVVAEITDKKLAKLTAILGEQRKDFPPGTRVLFSAINENNSWKITAIRENQKESSVEAVKIQKTIWFHVPEASGCDELSFAISTDLFGLVQSATHSRTPLRPAKHKYRNLWIAINDCHPGEIIKPQLKFKYMAMGDVGTIKGMAEPVGDKIVLE